jgi:hypothetical protein
VPGCGVGVGLAVPYRCATDQGGLRVVDTVAWRDILVAEQLGTVTLFNASVKGIGPRPKSRPATELTHRENLTEQLKRHVQEFDSSRNDLYIRLRELKEYAEAKRENPSLFGAGPG